jgi:uncharacterized C2H2 Zn-finger protein
MPTDNKIIYQCPKCSKNYKSNITLQKHIAKCNVNNTTNVKEKSDDNKSEPIENTYDVNVTFTGDNKIAMDVHKHEDNSGSDFGSEAGDSDQDVDGKEALKDMLRPKVSPTYQDEINKLEKLIDVFKNIPISDNPEKSAHMVEQLKTTLTILMAQSRRLINEMKLMARRNSFYKNNILMATFILDKCRREQPPETDEEFDAMFD